MATIDTKTKDPFSILDKMKWDDNRFRLENGIHDDLRKASDALPSPLTPDGKYLLPKEQIGKALVGRLIRMATLSTVSRPPNPSRCSTSTSATVTPSIPRPSVASPSATSPTWWPVTSSGVRRSPRPKRVDQR